MSNHSDGVSVLSRVNSVVLGQVPREDGLNAVTVYNISLVHPVRELEI